MPPRDEIKSRLSRGDKVSFVHGGGQIFGTVQKLNPTMVIVLCPSRDSASTATKEWNVPYRLLAIESVRADYSGQEQEAAALARRLMDEHDLQQWHFAWDEATSRAGVCRYDKHTIGLSRLFVRQASAAELRDTILHEIAHALAGPGHHHDHVWKEIAQSIGCSGDRCCEKPFAPKQWLRRCPNGCFPPRASNRRSFRLICRKCRARIIHERNIVVD
ncbi:MAG: SprT-like domain-containing protein [Gammaproteobacteria bacterium]